MKKLLITMLALSCAFAMFACESEKCADGCVDEDKNCVCDVCGHNVECTDADVDGTCDLCGKNLADKGECRAHVDTNKDTKCDTCGVLIPCTSHVDVNKDAKCDVCGVAIVCNTHVDADKNAVCDVCGAAVKIVCFNHIDENADKKCDICQAEIKEGVEAESNYAEDAADFIAAFKANAKLSEVNASVLYGEMVSEFVTVYNEDGSYVMNYKYPVYSDDLFEENISYVTGALVFDKDGNCVEGDASLASGANVKADLASDKIKDYTVSENVLSVKVAAADTAEIIGVALANDATVNVVMNDGKIDSITLNYTDAAGVDVQTVVSYVYA